MHAGNLRMLNVGNLNGFKNNSYSSKTSKLVGQRVWPFRQNLKTDEMPNSFSFCSYTQKT